MLRGIFIANSIYTIKQSLAIGILSLFFLVEIAFGSAGPLPKLTTKINQVGDATFIVDYNQIGDPTCNASIQFSANKLFSENVFTFNLPQRNYFEPYRRIHIELSLPGIPFDSNKKQINKIYTRLSLKCVQRWSQWSGFDKNLISFTDAQILSLPKLKMKNEMPLKLFLENLTAKSFPKSKIRYNNFTDNKDLYYVLRLLIINYDQIDPLSTDPVQTTVSLGLFKSGSKVRITAPTLKGYNFKSWMKSPISEDVLIEDVELQATDIIMDDKYTELRINYESNLTAIINPKPGETIPVNTNYVMSGTCHPGLLYTASFSYSNKNFACPVNGKWEFTFFQNIHAPSPFKTYAKIEANDDPILGRYSKSVGYFTSLPD